MFTLLCKNYYFIFFQIKLLRLMESHSSVCHAVCKRVSLIKTTMAVGLWERIPACPHTFPIILTPFCFRPFLVLQPHCRLGIFFLRGIYFLMVLNAGSLRPRFQTLTSSDDSLMWQRQKGKGGNMESPKHGRKALF